jgi:hypothetical protein
MQSITVQRLLACIVLGTLSTVVLAQWIGYPTPGIPRKADGSADLTAPAPRTRDNKPDLSGMWFAAKTVSSSCRKPGCISEERMAREQVNLGLNMPGGLPYTEWSKQRLAERAVNGGREDPHAYCLPPNYPRAWTLPQYTKIVQTPDLIVMLHEFNASYRQVMLDGRPLPVDPNPTWNGYSIGHWEGDTMVIDTNGIRDDMWLDLKGSPITSAAHVTEKLKRINFGTLQLEITVDDPKAYTRPWSVALDFALEVDTQMLDEICLDDEQDVRLYQK